MFSKLVQIDLHEIGLKKDDIIDLEGFSDIHKGALNHLPELFEHRMNAVINEPRRFTFYGGDMLDAIGAKDKRWQQESVTQLSLHQQMLDFYEAVRKLTDLHKTLKAKSKYKTGKVLWGLSGNHEYHHPQCDQTWLKAFFEGNEKAGIEGLGVDYLGSRAMIGLQVLYKGKELRRWTILSVHGFGGGANAYTPLQNLKYNHVADVYLMGHLHQKISMEEMIVGFNFAEKKAVQRKIILGNTGSFTKSIMDDVDQWYDRRNKLIPSSAGTITVSFDAYKGDMHHHI